MVARRRSSGLVVLAVDVSSKVHKKDKKEDRNKSQINHNSDISNGNGYNTNFTSNGDKTCNKNLSHNKAKQRGTQET